jgi:4-amino-4-deoxy-L-arabinose transferase-like glycosyltransferase
MLGVFAAYKLGTLAGGKTTGILCALFLVLTPRYYGHAFNNSKDIPFATGYLWSLYFIVRLLRELPRPTIRAVLSTGAAIGLTLGVRITGLLLLAYLFLAATIILIRLHRSGNDRLGVYLLLEQFTILCAVAYVTMFVFWPWAQAHPLGGPIDAFSVFTAFAEEHFTVFGGVYVSSLEIPREYALTWLSLTLPETTAIGLAFLIAAIILRKRSDLAVRNLDLIGLLSLAALVPVLYVVLNRTPLYDGIRHLLFAVPPLAILAALGTNSLYRTIRRPSVRRTLCTVTVMALGLTWAEMVRIHPYQSSYFNYVVAGTIDEAWLKYDSDYWQNSYKQGIAWIVDNYPTLKDRKVRVAGLFAAGVKYQLDSPITRPFTRGKNLTFTSPRYALANIAPSRANTCTPSRPGLPNCFISCDRTPVIRIARSFSLIRSSM